MRADVVVVVAGMPAVHLRPVEPDEAGVRGAGAALGQEEPARVEPRLRHPAGQVVRAPRPLLGVLGERAGVEREPGLLVPSGLEGARGDPRRQRRVRDRGEQAAAHLPQRPGGGESHPGRQRSGRAVRAVRPQPYSVGRVLRRLGAGGLLSGLDQRPSIASSAVHRVHHDLRAGPGHLVGHVEVGVSDQLAPGASGEEVAGVLVPAVAQVQHDVLAERTDPVRHGRCVDDRSHPVQLAAAEPTRHLDGCGWAVHVREGTQNHGRMPAPARGGRSACPLGP